MAKILFINPRIREQHPARHIPYGIALLASVCRDEGHQVAIYDENAWRKGQDTIKEVILADDWDVIGIGGLTTTYGNIKETCQLIKQVLPNVLLIAGGGFITSMPKDIMNWVKEIDLGVLGESFITIKVILEKVDKKDFDFSKTLGVIYRKEDESCVMTNVRPSIADLDTIPYPAWDLLPMDIYFENSSLPYSEEAFTSKRRIDINGSYGCGMICRYCWHLGTTGDMLIEKDESGENDVRFSYGRNIRYHSPKYIVDQVKKMVELYDIDFVGFLDENLFTMDAYSKKTWLKEICRLWIEAGLQPTCRRDGVPHDENCKGVHWSGTSHAGLHDTETIKMMGEAGCSYLIYGLETFDKKLVRTIGKGASANQNLNAVKVCLDGGVRPIPNIIIGFPEETFDSVRNNIHALLKLGIHSRPHLATPYPGSEWYYTYKESIKEQYNGDLEQFILELGDTTNPSGVISHKFSAMDLVGLQEIVHQRDLRLLDQAERTWGNGDPDFCKNVAIPNLKPWNILRKKVAAPLEEVSK